MCPPSHQYTDRQRSHLSIRFSKLFPAVGGSTGESPHEWNSSDWNKTVTHIVFCWFSCVSVKMCDTFWRLAVVYIQVWLALIPERSADVLSDGHTFMCVRTRLDSVATQQSSLTCSFLSDWLLLPVGQQQLVNMGRCRRRRWTQQFPQCTGLRLHVWCRLW